jgi:hypothetical protein
LLASFIVSRRLLIVVGSLGVSLAVGCRGPAVDTPDEGEDADPEVGDASLRDEPAPPEASVEAGPDVSCAPRTCEELGYDCGTASDGCGGTLTCGTCAAPQTCSGAGGYNRCGAFPFQGLACLMVCSQLPAGANCNQLSDGCGHLMPLCGSGIECSLASQGTCGGGGVPFRCGSGATCTPLTCAQLNYDCGQYGDGCTGHIDCGSCAANQICGGGGFNRCGPKGAPSPSP